MRTKDKKALAEASHREDGAEERRESSLRAYFAAFDFESRLVLQAISLDMWPAYINACRQGVPNADKKMVFDHFHIMRHVVEAVNTVRKRENKALIETGDTTLTKSKYLGCMAPKTCPRGRVSTSTCSKERT